MTLSAISLRFPASNFFRRPPPADTTLGPCGGKTGGGPLADRGHAIGRMLDSP
jgi:hypothetical protein